MKKFIMLICTVLVLSLTFGLSASELKDMQNELTEKEKEIEEENLKLEQNQAEQEIVQGEIDDLDFKIISIEEEIRDLELQIEHKEEEISIKEDELEHAIQVKDEHYEMTKQRMTAMYKNNKKGCLCRLEVTKLLKKNKEKNNL